MLLNSRTSRMLIEAAEAEGLTRSSVLGPLGIAEADVVDEQAKVEWETIVRIADQVSRLVGHDAERLRGIGRRMSLVPSYAPLRRLAGGLVSARSLYTAAFRYAARASFPHVRMSVRFEGGRMYALGEIPTSYAPCSAFFYISEGSITHLALLLDLPPATIVTSRVTARRGEFVVALPRSRSILDRIRRAGRAVRGARDAIAVLQEQQQELEGHVEALRQARDELRALLDGLPDLAVVHTPTTVLWANDTFLSTLGYELGDIVGRPLSSIVPEALAAPVVAEITLRTRSGAEVVVELAPSRPVVFDGVSAQLVVGRDVTERKRMRENLIIADRLASVGLLAAGVAHEVNNPLAYVLNNIEIARNELAAFDTRAATGLHALRVALEGVDRIRAIVRDLLMLSRGEGGPVRAVDVCAVAESMLALAAHEINRTSRLVSALEPTPLVHASDGRIAQVLLNLVANALEAMRDRPREQNELSVRVGPTADGAVLIEVSDTGRGIRDADLPRVFEPFFTTKPAGEGTGLGLSIAHRLVIELGGDISISSVVGTGTTFRVRLPAAPPVESTFIDGRSCSAVT